MELAQNELSLILFVLQAGVDRDQSGRFYPKVFPTKDQGVVADIFKKIIEHAPEGEPIPEQITVSFTTTEKTLLLGALDRPLDLQQSRIAPGLREKLEGKEETTT